MYVCVVQFASNKPFTMRARSVNATLYSPGLVYVCVVCYARFVAYFWELP